MLAAALPSSVFAVGLLADGGQPGAGSQFAFTPASADPQIAELIAQTGAGQARMIRFTPAGSVSSGAERSVTVAVRVDQELAQALGASAAAIAQQDNAETATGLRLAPTRYNLGVARGYGSFVQTPSSRLATRPAAAATGTQATRLSRSLSNAEIPDLADFAPRAGAAQDESRFAARIALDRPTPVAGRDERESVGNQLLDVGGSYSLTRNLDITAGVRYEQDRDILPLPDVDKQDSQAVYIGTQFRF
jgi:hypothetical protein